MPPRRYGYRRGYRRRSYGRRRGSTAVVAGSMRTKRVKAYRDYPLYAPVVGLPKVEMKYHVAVNGTPLLASDPATQVYLLNEIAQADQLDRRTTNKIRMEALIMRAYVRPPAIVNYISVGGIAIVYDKQTNLQLPVLTDMFESSSPFSFQYPPNRSRFEVLYRKNWDVVGSQANVASYTAKTVHMLEVKIPLNHIVTYSGSTGAIGEINTGGLFLVVFGTVAKGVANNECPDFPALFRLLFVDL